MNWKKRYEEIKVGDWVIVKTKLGEPLEISDPYKTKYPGCYLSDGTVRLGVIRVNKIPCEEEGFPMPADFVLFHNKRCGSGDYFNKVDIVRKD